MGCCLNSMNLLLVEDDVPLGGSLQQLLRGAGYPTVWVRTAVDAKRFLDSESFDLLLLDIVLPDESGLQVLQWLRARGLLTPTMMLTARDSVSDRVSGLDGGADDYLAKPFAVPELLSRVRALLRRQGSQRSALWQIGAIEIDTKRRKVSVEGDEVALSQREFDLLCVLATEPGKVITRLQLERTSPNGDELESNALDVHIHNLRKKLGSSCIETVRGVGYALGVSA
jgi:DNA-binding response OmpR family regulator